MIGKGHRNIALVIDNETDDASKRMVEGYPQRVAELLISV